MSLLPKTKKEFLALVIVFIFVSGIVYPYVGSYLGTKIPDFPSSVTLIAPTAILMSMFNWQNCANGVNCLTNDYLIFVALVSDIFLGLLIVFFIIYIFVRNDLLGAIIRILGCSFLLSIALAISFGTGYALPKFLALIFLLILYYQRKWGYLARF